MTPTRCLPPYWFSRLLLGLEVLVAVVIVSLVEPVSITAHAIEATGRAGWSLVFALGACCIVSILDVVVNDIAPATWHLRMALHWRHMGLLGIAMLLCILSVLIAFTRGHSALLYVYWLNAGAAVWLAFLDIFARRGQL